MSYRIQVELDKREDVPAEVTDVEKFVQDVLNEAGNTVEISGTVSVVLVNDEAIHEMNREFRDVDRPTDVLSFSLLEGDDSFPGFDDKELNPLGDIVVSIPTAILQAAEYNHSFRREFAFLLVHGFLHIVGFDHQDEESEREMFGLQEQVLAKLGLSRDS